MCLSRTTSSQISLNKIACSSISEQTGIEICNMLCLRTRDSPGSNSLALSLCIRHTSSAHFKSKVCRMFHRVGHRRNVYSNHACPSPKLKSIRHEHTMARQIPRSRSEDVSFEGCPESQASVCTAWLNCRLMSMNRGVLLFPKKGKKRPLLVDKPESMHDGEKTLSRIFTA